MYWIQSVKVEEESDREEKGALRIFLRAPYALTGFASVGYVALFS